MNKVIMTGYVVKDPEVNEFKRKRRRNKRASKYGLVASFRLSVRRPFKTKDGTKYDYFSCSAFDKSAEFIEEYIEKGDCVGIEGILLNDNYENEDGMTMYRDKINLDKIELLRKRKDEDENRIENAVCHRADGNGCHASHGISLRVDKRIHTGGDHGRQCTEQIDHQVRVCINQSRLGSAEQTQDRARKQKSNDH